MRGIQKHLNDFQSESVRPVAISVDPPDVSRSHRQKAGFTFTFLSDPKAQVIRRYGLLHAGASPDKLDISRPAEFLVDSSGIVRWVNFTEDVRVRARAEDILAAAEAIR